MKRILNILLIFTLILTLSIPAYAWTSDNPYENVSGLDVLNNSPVLFEGGHGVLYDASTETYYGFGGYGDNYSGGTYYTVDSSSGALTIHNYTGEKIQVYRWDGSSWVDQQIYSTWNMDGLTFVSCYVNFFVDGNRLEWDGYTLKFNDEVINPPSDSGDSGGSGNTGSDTDDDISNSGLMDGILSGITDFFTGLFEGIIALVDFVLGILQKLWELITEIPKLFTGFTDLSNAIVNNLSFLPDNTYVKNIVALGVLGIAIAVVNLVIGLFGSKFGGD